MNSLLRKIGSRIIRNVLAPELAKIRADIRAVADDLLNATTQSRAAVEQVKKLTRQLQTAQALDVDPLGESGKLILLVRVNGRDMVKIINIPADWTPRQYKELAEKMRDDYGANPSWVDHPPGMPSPLDIRG